MFIIIGYCLLVLASAVIALTMFARANDQRFKRGWRWHIRLVGFVLTGCGVPALATTTILAPTMSPPFTIIAVCGAALVFLTTPNQKPWHEWIWKGDGDEPL